MDVKIGGATSFEKGGACSNKGRYAEFSWYNTLSLVNFFLLLMLLVASGDEAFRCLMTKGGEMYPKSKQIVWSK